MDAATNKVTANVSVGDSPYEVLVTPDGKKRYTYLTITAALCL
ncbi:hypothetical protein [Methanosarcina barkeri]